MQNNKRSFAGLDPEPASNQVDASGRVQLSANMRCRLEKLAPLRIDPSLIEVPKVGPSFEGGCAVVSRALLYPSSDDTKYQLLGSKTGSLTTSNRASTSEGADECREAVGTDGEGKRRGKGATEGQEHSVDSGTPRRCKPIAVKRMKVKTRSDIVKVSGLMIREAEFLVNHSHENIIKLEGFVEDLSKNMLWLIFPWEENGSLKEFIDSAEWEIPERISLLHDVAKGMEYLHTRNPSICHGDLKSANILVNSECHAVITDFGSAHDPTARGPDRQRKNARVDPQPAVSPEATFCPSTNTITLTHNRWTLRWAAPELLKEDNASLASDVWAFGCVAYEVMTNSIPFQGVRDAMVAKRVVRGDLPSISSDARMVLIQALCTLVGQCWNIDPSNRPTSEECRGAMDWMPKIVPNPVRTADAASSAGRSAELLMELGSMHRAQDDYASASKYLSEALSLYTDIADGNGKANALLELAQIHLVQGSYSQALSSFFEALKIHTDIGNRRGRASALIGLAEVHRVQNEYRQAVIFYSECLKITTNIGDGLWRSYALKGLADVHSVQNEYLQAVTFYSECLQIYTDIGDRVGRASTLRSVAAVHQLQSEYSQAVTFYSECLQIYTEIGDRHGRASALWGLAEVYRFQSEYIQAVTFYSECLKIYSETGERYGRAYTLRGLADVHRLQNQYSQAVTSYSECLEIQTNIGDRQGRAEALWGLAEVHRLQNEYSQAITFYSESLQIFTETGYKYGRGFALCGLADVHRARNEHSQAVTLYSECLQIRTDIGDRYGRASALFGLAEVHRLRNEYSQAVALYSECLQIRTAIRDRLGRAVALFGLAQIHRLQTEHSKALNVFSEALQISIDIGNIFWKAFILFGVADTHHAQADYSGALHHYEQAAEAFQQLRDTHNEAAVRTRASDARQLLTEEETA